jgi:Na+/H+ antiporter NhaD/arsenite permease-like protein
MLTTVSIRHKRAQILNIFKGEVVFTLSATLAIITSFLSFPKIEYIDFKVLLTLFNLMIIVSAFKHIKIFDKIAITLLTKFDNSKKISLVLIYLTFFSSMLTTNDVELITLVILPYTI